MASTDITSITLTAGYTLPALGGQIFDENGPYAIPSGSTVQLALRGLNGEPYQALRSASIVNASTGMVSYDRSGAENDTPGHYIVQWIVTTPSGPKRVFPEDSYLNYHLIPST